MRLSVGAQLAAITIAVLTLVASALVVTIASSELERAVQQKTNAATMVTDLFAASVSAGVVFGDKDAVQAVLANLQRTEDVIAGAVFAPDSDVSLGSFGPALAPSAPGVVVAPTRLVVARNVVDNDGRVVGRASVAFSLAREHAGNVRTRRTLAVAGVVVIVFTATLLVWTTHRRVVLPLMELASAAKAIEEGETPRASEYRDPELSRLARAFNSMGDAVAMRERVLKAELQAAADLQLSILPRDVTIAGVETAASMRPATQVGGDYYDIIPTPDGGVIGIGDVSGHGLGAGVIMLMIQSAVSALVSANPDVSPVDIELAVNRVLYENIRARMGRRDHATLSILRYTRDGRIRFAGAHEDLIVYRAATGTVETIETPGTWVGARRDVARATVESELKLAADDVLVLYTDGVTEAMRNGEQLGLNRLVDIVRGVADGSAESVRKAVVDAVSDWTSQIADDVSVVVLKQARAEIPATVDVL